MPIKASSRRYLGSVCGKTVRFLNVFKKMIIQIRKMDTKTKNDKLLAWFAGFYEGEGHICNDTSNYNYLRVGIDQNDRTPLDIAQKLWGGTVRVRIRKSSASDKICKGHCWVMYKKSECLQFIEDIKPYMLIPYKIQQIDICLKKLDKKEKREFKCSFCNKSFPYVASRRRHEKTQHIEKGQLFQCQICNKTYKSRDTLTRHEKTHKSDASVGLCPMRHTLTTGKPLRALTTALY